jgi:hypothetical protein
MDKVMRMRYDRIRQVSECIMKMVNNSNRLFDLKISVSEIFIVHQFLSKHLITPKKSFEA